MHVKIMVTRAAFEMLVILIVDAFLRDDLRGAIALEHNKVDRSLGAIIVLEPRKETVRRRSDTDIGRGSGICTMMAAQVNARSLANREQLCWPLLSSFVLLRQISYLDPDQTYQP
jgi:hypothetical protein